jgi:tetratricopeptide (TPR) repeat protein
MSDYRIQQLKEFLREDPDDAFSAYALALEYLKMNDLPLALATLKELLERQPEYLAGYYQYGKALEALGKPDDAITAYKQGVSVAKMQGNKHTLAELQGALINLCDPDED